MPYAGPPLDCLDTIMYCFNGSQPFLYVNIFRLSWRKMLSLMCPSLRGVLRCGGIFSDSTITNFLFYVPVQKTRVWISNLIPVAGTLKQFTSYMHIYLFIMESYSQYIQQQLLLLLLLLLLQNSEEKHKTTVNKHTNITATATNTQYYYIH